MLNVRKSYKHRDAFYSSGVECVNNLRSNLIMVIVGTPSSKEHPV